MPKFLDIKKGLEKEYPLYTKVGNDITSFAVPRIKTDIFSLDLLTGGGLPKDRIVIIWGNKSSGKTTLMLKTIGKFLENNKDEVVLYADLEHSYDPIWASNFIAKEDMCRLHIIQPDYGELAIDMIMKYSQSDDLGMIVVDSIAMLIPTKEAEGDAGDQNIGLQARLVNKFFRKIIPVISQKKRLLNKHLGVFLINQPRVKFGGHAFGAQTMKVGGMMQDLVNSLDIHMYTKEYKKVKGIPAKVVHTFTIEKNKLGLAKRSGEYIMALEDHDNFKTGDIDDFKIVTSYAKRCGILKKEGTKWIAGSKEFTSLLAVSNFLEENKEAFQKVKEKTLQLCMNNVFAISEEGDTND